jgi:6-phosphogluconolactonase (cycloisomerase 2 family)
MKQILVRALLFSPVLVVLFAGELYAQGDFVYTNNDVDGPNTVSGFSADSNGTLTQVSGSPFLTGGMGSGGGAFAANRIRVLGNFLFTSNSRSADISVFTINPTTGKLGLVAGSPFPAQVFGGNGISLALTTGGKFLFAAGVDSNTIKAFGVSSNGALTPLVAPPIPSGGSVLLGINVSPDNKFLAVTHAFPFSLSAVQMFSIGADGSLTQLAGAPFHVGGVEATSVEFNCASNLLFVGQHSGLPTTDVVSVASNGMLTPIPGTPFIQTTGNLGNSAQVVLLSPDERFLFVSNQFSNTVTVWSVAPNGSLALVPGSSFWCGGNNSFRIPAGMATNKTGTLLFVATDHFGSSSRAVSVFRIDVTGFLTLVPGSPFNVGQGEDLNSLAAYPAKTCVPAFDTCLQDDSNGNVFQINLTTGAYLFSNCGGLTLGGTGRIVRKGCYVTLQINGPDRRVLVRMDLCARTGTASIQIFSSGTTFTIMDRNTANNTCACANGS